MIHEDQIHGMFVPVVTPFQHNGEIDLVSFRRHVERLLEAGVHGLVVNGTTGEAPTISDTELGLLASEARSAIGTAEVPLLLGTGTNDTAGTIRRTRLAAELGADAALVVVPYYNKPSQEGITAHFNAVLETGVPVMVYDVPHRTGVALTPETTALLMRMDGIIGMKDSSGGVRLHQEASRHHRKPVLCGDDELLVAMLGCGAAGAMAASANVLPEKFVELYACWKAGDLERARSVFAALLPMILLFGQGPSPAPIKWVLAHTGVIASDTVRLPITRISEPLASSLKEVYSGIIRHIN